MKFMLKIQNGVKNKFLLISIILIILSFLYFYFNLAGITGFNAIDVSIKEKTQGEIRLNYQSIVNLTNAQNITAEFVNTGTTNYSARIEITVYIYNETTGVLQELANYYDTSSFLYPSAIKVFRTVFLPRRTGTYYVKVRVSYDAKVAEMWGSFFVVYYYTQTPKIIYVPVSYGGGTIPRRGEGGIADLELKYKNKLDIYPGQEILIDLTVNNTGTINLHNLKFYSTTTNFISFEVNPKEIYELGYNESRIFLVSLELSEDIPSGEYDFFFEVLGLEIRKSGTIELNVTSFAKPIRDEVYETILNYEYLITELDHEIYLTSLKDLNTTRAEEYLNDARKNLQKAREYFDNEEYEKARDVLDLVKKDLEKVVFELSAIAFRVYIYPAFSPFLILILLIMILIGILFLIHLYRKRKKKKKPKLLREFTEEET